MMFLQENVQLDPAGRGSAAAGSSGSTCKPAELCLSPSRGEYQDPGLLSLLEGSGRINEFTAQECSQETTTRESEQLQTWKVCEAETRAPCGEAKKKREVRMSQRRKTSGISDTAPSRALRAAFQVLHLGFPGGIRARLGQVLLLQPCCWYPWAVLGVDAALGWLWCLPGDWRPSNTHGKDNCHRSVACERKNNTKPNSK